MRRFPETESNTLEFKRSLPQNDQIIKTVIGFCNLYGGRVVIGVDNDRSISGIEEAEAELLLERLPQILYERTSPPILPQIYIRRFEEAVTVIIEVGPGMNKPYFLVEKGVQEGTYVRVGRSTMKATPQMIDELRWQARGKTFDQMPIYQAKRSELEEAPFHVILQNRRGKITRKASSKENDSLLVSYGLLTTEHGTTYPTVAGMLLFGKKPQSYLTESFIIGSVFRGTQGREVLRTKDFTGSLFEQFEEAYSFVLDSLSRSFSIQNKIREEILEIPPIAIREALMNAIVHRNYAIPAPTKIALYEDRVEIFSPGIFPGPISPEELESGITYLRNPHLCKVLRVAGYVEKLGTGLATIFESYRQAQLLPPTIIEGSGFVKCVLPRRAQAEVSSHEDSIETQIAQLAIQQGEISNNDVMRVLNVSRATAARHLTALVKEGKFKREGEGRATRYILKSR